MSSGITCTIKLEPFLQQFLRGYYHNNSDIFRFPKLDTDDLGIARKFSSLLKPKPDKFKFQSFGSHSFIIELPFNPDRDPQYFNYLSDSGNGIFINYIADQQTNYFHERMAELRNDGWDYKDCITIYMDELNIDVSNTDRLIKDYYRWRTSLRVQKFRQKTYLKQRAYCPTM